MPQGLRLPKGTEQKHAAAQKAAKDIMPDWLEQALNLIGMGPDTPLEDQVAGGMQPNPVGAVSVFMKAGGGGKAAREASTGKTMTKLKEVLQGLELLGESTPKQTQEVLDLYGKYPRVVSHFEDVALEPEFPIAGIRAGIDPSTTKPGTARLLVSPRSREATSNTTNVFAEELGHGAQNIGLKEHAMPLYKEAHNLVGYEKVPHEISAKWMAAKRAPVIGPLQKLLGITPDPGPKPPNIIDQLKALGLTEPGSTDFHSYIKRNRK